ncbi:hypothetical protein [uncultured Roseovarius sp.]|uniref:hypothetical protein n=1 Tax=uncultured Roseovarius sp. TaxID=293344 RepID=UPI00261A296A|nr:hypothetical protein [uncultured Roseovarius sp.]
MATALQKIEADPMQYPALPVGLSQAALAAVVTDQRLNSMWKRIESHVAHRWTARTVTWVVEGAGEWLPSLTPVVDISTVEQWQDSTWVPVTVSPTPMGGLYFPSDCHHRVVANVGAGPAPDDVTEAFRRLAEYLAGIRGNASEVSFRRSVGDVTNTVRTEPDFMGMALQKSGAADLLRDYRSVV